MNKWGAIAILSISCYLPVCAQAQIPPTFDVHLAASLAEKTDQGISQYLSAPDQFGTPLIIKLARQGDTQTVLQLASKTRSGQFLLTTDSYGNTVFHVAKDAATVQTLAALLRNYYGTKAPSYIRKMMNQRNQQGETPLHAQINAGHTDTFAPMYAYTDLKQTNDQVQTQVTRLHGMDERIVSQHQAIYCQEVKKLGSGHGQTILQAAQAMAAVQPQMGKLAGHIQHTLPCLSL